MLGVRRAEIMRRKPGVRVLLRRLQVLPLCERKRFKSETSTVNPRRT